MLLANKCINLVQHIPRHKRPRLVSASRAPIRCFTFICKLQWFCCDEHDVNGVVFNICDDGACGGMLRKLPFACPFGISFVGVRTIDGAVWCDIVDTFNGCIERLSNARVAAAAAIRDWICGGGGGGCFGCFLK